MRSRSSSTSSRPGSSTRSAAARRSTCWPRASPPSAISASTRGSSARTRCSAGCCGRRTRSRPVCTRTTRRRESSSTSPSGSILEVAHEDSRKDFRAINDVLDVEISKLEELSREGKDITGTPSGFADLDTYTGGFQPGNLIILAARPSMGKSALMANFCENAALDGDKAVALFSLEMSESELAQRFIASQASIKGDDLRKGRVPAVALGQDHGGVEPAGEVAAVHRRLVRSLGARRPREGAPAPPAAPGRPRADRHRLPAADARRRADGQPRRADRPDLPRAQDARARARVPRHRALPAQPRRRAADGQAPGALRPPRVGLDRAGRGPRDVHLPRRVLRQGVRARGDRRPDHLQAPQRRPGDGRDDVPEGVPAVHVVRGRRPVLCHRAPAPTDAATARASSTTRPPGSPARAPAARCGSPARRPPRSRAGSRSATARSPSTASRCARSSAPTRTCCARSASTSARSRSSSTPAAGSGSPATSGRARRRSRCSSPRPRWRPTGRSPSTRCRGCSACCATPTPTARGTRSTSSSTGWPPSTCCTSTTSVRSRPRPGCSSSSTRSSTPATRTARRSSSRRT